MADILTFKPKTITKKVLAVLPEKAQDILRKRFGLDDTERMTLEAIGQIYGITRERVRQIENFAIQSIKKSDVFGEIEPVFVELHSHLHDFGRGLAHEDEFLSYLHSDQGTQNHLRFYLVLGLHPTRNFVRMKDDDHFYSRWAVDTNLAERVHDALHDLKNELSEEDLLSHEEMVSRFASRLKSLKIREDEPALERWLSISKGIARNPLGDWGVAHSPSIKIRGMRDLAFLVLRKSGEPLHFADVAEQISKQFARDAHVATCHNELIKDSRFVLVGRGLYALTEWGYRKGTVRDIITSILKDKGPLTKDEIIGEVKKERFIKESTIAVNLQNSNYFKRRPDGKYLPA